jgi:hypothetical protein
LPLQSSNSQALVPKQMHIRIVLSAKFFVAKYIGPKHKSAQRSLYRANRKAPRQISTTETLIV